MSVLGHIVMILIILESVYVIDFIKSYLHEKLFPCVVKGIDSFLKSVNFSTLEDRSE
jgi:hypothetical protein